MLSLVSQLRRTDVCIHEHLVNMETDIEPLNEPLLSFEDLKDFYEPSSKIVNVTGINFTIHGRSEPFFFPMTRHLY